MSTVLLLAPALLVVGGLAVALLEVLLSRAEVLAALVPATGTAPAPTARMGR